MLRRPLLLVLVGCGGPPCEPTTFWLDLDGDGFGGDTRTSACEPPPSGVPFSGDCDDADPAVFPGAVETCDGADQDCNGAVDDDPTPRLYVDEDADGYGDPDRPLPNCDAWGVPDATDCDDADPTWNPGTTWYVDDDRDGVGAAPSGTGCERPQPTDSARGGDCDDADPERHPGAAELCDGVDQDCLDAPEAVQAWAFPELAVRVPLTVQAPAGSDLPLALDLDLRAALLSVGADEPFDPASLRLAVQDCGGPWGTTPLPVQFLDGARRILAAGAKADPLGDEAGAIVALWDLDADAATLEPWPDGSVALALYFQGAPAPMAFASDLEADPDRLAAAGLVVTVDSTRGGLLDTFGPDGGPSVADQADTTQGNGVLTPSGGLSAQNFPGTTELLDQGPVTAAIRGAAHLENPSGELDASTTYRRFAGRAALWVSPSQRATTDLAIRGVDDRTEPLRPFEVRVLRPEPLCTLDPGLRWGDAGDAVAGLTWVWVAPPTFVNYAGCTEDQLWTAANDLANGAVGQGDRGVVVGGSVIVDEPVAVWLAHGPGGPGAVSAQRDAWQTPPTVVVGLAETWRIP